MRTSSERSAFPSWIRDLRAVVKTDKWIKHEDFRIRADVVLDRQGQAPLAAGQMSGKVSCSSSRTGWRFHARELARADPPTGQTATSIAPQTGSPRCGCEEDSRPMSRRWSSTISCGNEDYIAPESLGVDVESRKP